MAWKNVQYENGKYRASEGGGGGGSSTFAGLDDVSFSSVQDGQVPKYNSTTHKWENADESDGGGTVTDVQVDGVSVVNQQGVAKITSYGKWQLVGENTTSASWEQGIGEMSFFICYWNEYALYSVFIGLNGSIKATRHALSGNIGTEPTFSYSNGTVTATWGSANYAKVLK